MTTYDEYHRDYYQANRDRLLRYQSAYYQANKERLRESSGARTRRWRAGRREWLNELKLERGCIDCGYREHAAALQFDHRDPDTKVQSTARRRGITTSWSKERLLAEIEKCDVRCANCHAVRSFAEGHHNIGHERLGHCLSK